MSAPRSRAPVTTRYGRRAFPSTMPCALRCHACRVRRPTLMHARGSSSALRQWGIEDEWQPTWRSQDSAVEVMPRMAAVRRAISPAVWPEWVESPRPRRALAGRSPLCGAPPWRKSGSGRGSASRDARHRADSRHVRSTGKRRRRGPKGDVLPASMAGARVAALTAGGFPAVDHRDARVLEMPSVTRGEQGSPGKGDAGQSVRRMKPQAIGAPELPSGCVR
jgi:hypothetical protein